MNKEFKKKPKHREQIIIVDSSGRMGEVYYNGEFKPFFPVHRHEITYWMHKLKTPGEIK